MMRAHGARTSGPRVEHAVLMLKKVASDPEVRLHSYPHQLSGGMAQRITIAMHSRTTRGY